MVHPIPVFLYVNLLFLPSSSPQLCVCSLCQSIMVEKSWQQDLATTVHTASTLKNQRAGLERQWLRLLTALVEGPSSVPSTCVRQLIITGISSSSRPNASFWTPSALETPQAKTPPRPHTIYIYLKINIC